MHKVHTPHLLTFPTPYKHDALADPAILLYLLISRYSVKSLLFGLSIARYILGKQCSTNPTKWNNTSKSICLKGLIKTERLARRRMPYEKHLHTKCRIDPMKREQHFHLLYKTLLVQTMDSTLLEVSLPQVKLMSMNSFPVTERNRYNTLVLIMRLCSHNTRNITATNQ